MLDSDGRTQIPFYQGHRVIVDDGAPRTAITGGFKYTSYIFARGALVEAVASGGKVSRPIRSNPNAGTWSVEMARDAHNAVDSYMVRQKFLIHCPGVKWLDAVNTGNTGPTNAELANGANWSRVYEQKNIRLVRFIHNVQS